MRARYVHRKGEVARVLACGVLGSGADMVLLRWSFGRVSAARTRSFGGPGGRGLGVWDLNVVLLVVSSYSMMSLQSRDPLM